MPKRITVVCGAYGSGKTEFAVSYALSLKKEGNEKVGLVDLDIVNPYFRSRDIAAELSNEGLSVVFSDFSKENADIPALSPRIFALLQDTSYRVVFDVGGDPAGARALGRFHEYFLKETYDFWVVVNPYRPDTRSVDEAAELIAGLQRTSRLQATGLVGNINLGRETTPEIWTGGLKLIGDLSERVGLPVVYQAVEEHFWTANREILNGHPLFSITLRMLTPWLLAEPFINL